jgi:hypothetical protein
MLGEIFHSNDVHMCHRPKWFQIMGSAFRKKDVRLNGERGQTLMKTGVRLNEDRVRHCGGEKDWTY